LQWNLLLSQRRTHHQSQFDLSLLMQQALCVPLCNNRVRASAAVIAAVITFIATHKKAGM
jgi:hypothetical protein